MDCSQARTGILQALDGELPPARRGDLDGHLAACPRCAREHRLLSLPRRLARALPVFEPSPGFHERLRARLESTPEAQELSIWQILPGLARPIVPALACVTLVVVSVFLHTALRAPSTDVQGYDGIFTGERTPHIVEDLSDEGALLSLLEWGQGEVGSEAPAQSADPR